MSSNHMYKVGKQTAYMSSKSHTSKQMPRSVMACLAARSLAHEMSASPVFLPQPTKEEVELQPEKAFNPERAQHTA